MIASTGFNICYAAQKDVKSKSGSNKAVIQKAPDAAATAQINMEGPAGATGQSVAVKQKLPPPKDQLLSLLSIMNVEEFNAKFAEMNEQYILDESLIKQKWSEVNGENKILEPEYERCLTGNSSSLIRLAKGSEDIILKYHICRRLANGADACNDLQEVDMELYKACAKDDLTLWYWFRLFPGALSPNATDSSFASAAKNMCDSVPADCNNLMTLMLKTMNAVLVGENIKACDSIDPVPYKRYCKAVFNKDFTFCNATEKVNFNLCWDNLFQRILDIKDKDLKVYEKARETKDISDMLTAWYIKPNACEYSVGSYSDKYCDAIKAIVNNKSQEALKEWIDKHF